MGAREIHVAELEALSELLLGIAYADGRFHANEADVIRKILESFADIAALPETVVATIADFDASRFDLGATCARLSFDGPEDRRNLLRLLLKVVDADQVRDRQEEHYFFQVARIIGAKPEEYSDLLW